MKYARIVQLFADSVGMKYEDALGVFYNSDVYKMMSQGVADMHCLSDGYLADELKIEIFDKTKGSLKCDGLIPPTS